jgi:hypothetical protein
VGLFSYRFSEVLDYLINRTRKAYDIHRERSWLIIRLIFSKIVQISEKQSISKNAVLCR